jgi:hypothetical protein
MTIEAVSTDNSVIGILAIEYVKVDVPVRLADIVAADQLDHMIEAAPVGQVRLGRRPPRARPRENRRQNKVFSSQDGVVTPSCVFRVAS